MSLKDTLVDAARSLGFERLVVGSLEPLSAEKDRYEGWLASGFAADMDYLKRNPHFRTSPGLLYPGSKSVIIVSVSYYSPLLEKPGPLFGRVARYAAGLDYHAVLRAKLRELKGAIEKAAQRPLLGKSFTDDVALYEPGLANRYGLGFQGRNTMIIGPKLSGSYYFVGELFTDLELEPDFPYQGTCGNCVRCVDACPTGAILPQGTVDAKLCISYLTIENKGAVPRQLRAQMKDWLFGCDVCQDVCPYNQKPPLTPWPEFQPDKGAGHYVDLLSLLSIRDDDEFRRRFGHTPLRRPKRRGLLRNALVVMGNILRESLVSDSHVDHVQEGLNGLFQFAWNERDLVLKEHACWAIAQAKALSSAKLSLERILGEEADTGLRDTLTEYLEDR